jgi:TPR repeat protein
MNSRTRRIACPAAALALLLLAPGARMASAQTLLQRCLGIVPGREPAHKIGPSPATMSYCQQIPGWSLYEQAGQRFQSGDHAGAARLALQAAEAGNPVAQYRLAGLYGHGDGMPRNSAAALRWLKAAASQNEPLAENDLGQIYEYGRSKYDVDDDWDLAAKMWLASASQGWSLGEFAMGRAYQYGIGVPLDLNKAINWYDKAAAQGHGQAVYFAKYLRDNHGFDGSSRDDDERAILGPLPGRTMPFSPPAGVEFHHLAERLAFVKREYVDQENAKAAANYTMRARRYKECRDAGGDSCLPPGPPPR